MNSRKIDFYIKHLPMDKRLTIFQLMEKINSARVKKLLEKPQNYPGYRSMGYTDEDIQVLLNQCTQRFRAVNDYMEQNGRYPLFTDPTDTYRSALEYGDLLKERTAEELIGFFGCTWQDYEPRTKAPTGS